MQGGLGPTFGHRRSCSGDGPGQPVSSPANEQLPILRPVSGHSRVGLRVSEPDVPGLLAPDAEELLIELPGSLWTQGATPGNIPDARERVARR